MSVEFPIWTQTRQFSARVDRTLISAAWFEGVLSGLKVSQREAGANMSVDVAVGRAIVDGDNSDGQNSYLCVVATVENAAVTAAPGSDSRYDIVVARVYDPTAGGGGGASASFAIEVVAGTPSATPVAPNVPDTAILLATIGPITTLTTSITTGLITDSRSYAARRGIPGEYMQVAHSRSVTGWLACYGQAVSRTAYAALFDAIGTTHGAGDGSSTFNVPDLRGRVLAGVDNMGGTQVSDGTRQLGSTIGATSGARTHQLTVTEIPGHTHGGATGSNSAAHTHTFSATTGTESNDHTHSYARDTHFVLDQGTGWDVNSTYYGGSTGTTGGKSATHTHTVSGTTSSATGAHTHTIAAEGGDAAHNNLQPTMLANTLICT